MLNYVNNFTKSYQTNNNNATTFSKYFNFIPATCAHENLSQVGTYTYRCEINISECIATFLYLLYCHTNNFTSKTTLHNQCYIYLHNRLSFLFYHDKFLSC